MEIIGMILCFGIAAFCISAAIKWESVSKPEKTYEDGLKDGYRQAMRDAPIQGEIIDVTDVNGTAIRKG